MSEISPCSKRFMKRIFKFDQKLFFHSNLSYLKSANLNFFLKFIFKNQKSAPILLLRLKDDITAVQLLSFIAFIVYLGSGIAFRNRKAAKLNWVNIIWGFESGFVSLPFIIIFTILYHSLLKFLSFFKNNHQHFKCLSEYLTSLTAN